MTNLSNKFRPFATDVGVWIASALLLLHEYAQPSSSDPISPEGLAASFLLLSRGVWLIVDRPVDNVPLEDGINLVKELHSLYGPWFIAATCGNIGAAIAIATFKLVFP